MRYLMFLVIVAHSSNALRQGSLRIFLYGSIIASRSPDATGSFLTNRAIQSPWSSRLVGEQRRPVFFLVRLVRWRTAERSLTSVQNASRCLKGALRYHLSDWCTRKRLLGGKRLLSWEWFVGEETFLIRQRLLVVGRWLTSGRTARHLCRLLEERNSYSRRDGTLLM